jgi:lysophospholipase L1-like esterase
MVLKNRKRLTIVGFGASIIEAAAQMPDKNKRWLNVLRTRLAAAFPNMDFTVINSGVGGNSVREAMARFDKDVLTHDPDWVLLDVGANNNSPQDPARRVPPDEVKRHLEDFKTRIPPKTRVAVITTPPVIEEQHIYGRDPYFKPFGGLEASVELYRVLMKDFAAENGFPLVDLAKELRRRMETDGKNCYTLTDGIHLTEAGNRLLADMVFEVLRSQIVCEGRVVKGAKA